jgi:hypothetical protein
MLKSWSTFIVLMSGRLFKNVTGLYISVYVEFPLLTKEPPC